MTMGPWGERSSTPAQETRGGNRVDWAQAVPGEALPELAPDAYPEPDSQKITESTEPVQMELPLDYGSEDEA
jgi:hypothetical protein